ncbi:hypothetical protein F2Q68_00044965 [Brassica cretica]|uniref:WRKY domain-containing protein n=2 Tax=Brassica cretica TaxID=69181 RepID=A0A8S9LTK1_BRACR|nr:hypothetical protein F2Q68_00044965 [Brassica cretica]
MEEILSKIFNGINLVEELKFNLSAQESPESLSSSLGSISTLFRDANERLGILLERKNAFVPNQPEPKPVQVSGLDQMMMQIEPGLKQDHRVRERVIRLRLGPDDSGPGCAFLTPRPRRRCLNKKIRDHKLKPKPNLGEQKKVEELKFNLSAQESPESLSSSLGSISTLFRDANERLGTLLERKNAFVPNQPEPKPVQVSGLDQMMMQIEPGLKQDHRVREGVKSIDSGPGCAFSTPRPRRSERTFQLFLILYAEPKFNQNSRSYYRCNHQKVYKCPAKKQVQRLDEDPYMLRVTYRSSHTCQFSTTSSFSSTATTPVNYGPNVHNMADLMFENTDSVIPFCEPYFNNDSLVPGAASYEDSWKSTWQSYDMS